MTQNSSKTHPLLEGAGLAALYVLPFAAPFLTPSLGDTYHHLQPFSSIPRAILIMALLLWLLAWLGFAAAERLPARMRRVAWIIPLVLLVWLVCRAAAIPLSSWPMAVQRSLVVTQFAPRLAAVLAILLLLRPRLLDRAIAWLRLLYTIAGFGMLFLLPRLAYYSLPSGPLESASFDHASLLPVSPAQPRIVWILMDELSYDQVFDHRQPSVALPHFDAFAKKSVVFSNLQPTGYYTEIIVPGLFLGKPVENLSRPYGAPLRYRSSEQGRWQLFDQRQTIFADAHALGWSTGIAGWYNPYCRLLPDVLDRCFWQFSDPDPGDPSHLLSSSSSTPGNLVALLPFRQRLRSIFRRSPLAPLQPNRQDYIDIMGRAEDLLRDQRIRFVFLHLPLPHPSGFYDRRHHRLATDGTYLDNLVLADESLGKLQDVLHSTQDSQQTTILLSSDHSWRVPIWSHGVNWSAEEERASGGRFDSRPVLLVHLAGSDATETITRPESALVVHRILEAALRDRLQTANDMTALLQ